MNTKQFLIQQIIELDNSLTPEGLYWYSLELEQKKLSELIKIKKGYK